MVDLREAGSAGPESVGGKAAKLGELIAAGFPIPEGRVLTTAAFDRFRSANNLGSDATASFADARIPDDITRAIRGIAASLGDTSLAVRSSGVAEDLSGASFAGQYETVLGVRGAEELERAVLRCWASVFSQRVAEYRKTTHREGDLSMAVLVQHLVNADAAGVTFTANPMTGDRDEVVINSVRGIGERLVSGLVTPDEWTVRGTNAVCKASPERSITAEQARDIAALAKRAERHFGSPQDVEWATSEGRLFLLQARPITSIRSAQVLPVQMPVEVPGGYWQFDEEHFGEPISPMEMSVSFSQILPATRLACKEFGFPFEGMEFRPIGGYIYVRIVPPGGKDRSPPPSWLMPLLVRVVPQVRSMNKRCVEAVKTDARGRFLNAWYQKLRPESAARIDELSIILPARLVDDGLEGYVSSAIKLYNDVFEIHMKSVLAMALPLWRFSSFCEEALGWSRRRVLELLTSKTTIEPSSKLAELSQEARANQALASALDSGVPSLESIRMIDPAFTMKLSTYLSEYCSITVGYDVAMPAMNENVSLIVGLIRRQMRKPPGALSNAEARRRRSLEEAERVVDGRGEREKFDRLLRDAELAYAGLDDTQFYTMRCRWLVRRGLLELGGRLAKIGVLAKAEDIFYLEIEEVRQALHGARSGLKVLVTRREGERAWAVARPPPKGYGTQPPTPSMGAFPTEVRDVLASLMWLFSNVLESGSSGTKAGVLSGIGVSSGRYTGPARIVRDESEFLKIRPGDVLVCSTTAPTWTILFTEVGGLVTDLGGFLSHPAIIAREYGIPAVLSTERATKALHDGDLVTVDGDKGEVILPTVG